MKIVVARHMNWEAIYIDGICKKQDDNTYACDIAYVLEDLLPCTIESFEIKMVDDNWWEKGMEDGVDGYPKNIEDVVFLKE